MALNCRNSRSSTRSIDEQGRDLRSLQSAARQSARREAGHGGEDHASTVLGLAGVYTQDLISLTEHWKVLAGLRFDYLTQTRHDYTAAGVNLDRTDRNWSPRVGLIYEPLDWVSLYATYSQSFSPLADTLISSGAFANGSSLAPQKTTSFEVGSKFNIGGRASSSVALFDMKQTNQQIADPSNPTYALPVGTQHSRGFELSLTGEIAPSDRCTRAIRV